MSELEQWAVCSAHSDYEVSNLGRVRCRVKRRYLRPGQLLRLQTISNGYIGAHIDGRLMLVHRLVCKAFHGQPPSPNHEVAHFNGVRTDNAAKNLRWATRKENAFDKRRHGTHRFAFGEHAGRAVLTTEQVREIRRLLGDGQRQSALAERFGVARTTISAIGNSYNWRHI